MSRERGAATILALSIISMLLAVTVGGLALSSALVASHRARSAADLAALAGAAKLVDGATAEAACAQASRVAAANHAELATCGTGGLTLDLTVLVPAPPWTEPARARARAGPARQTPSEGTRAGKGARAGGASAVPPGIRSGEQPLH